MWKFFQQTSEDTFSPSPIKWVSWLPTSQQQISLGSSTMLRKKFLSTFLQVIWNCLKYCVATKSDRFWLASWVGRARENKKRKSHLRWPRWICHWILLIINCVVRTEIWRLETIRRWLKKSCSTSGFQCWDLSDIRTRNWTLTLCRVVFRTGQEEMIQNKHLEIWMWLVQF